MSLQKNKLNISLNNLTELIENKEEETIKSPKKSTTNKSFLVRSPKSFVKKIKSNSSLTCLIPLKKSSSYRRE